MNCQTKKIPKRVCVVCKDLKPKFELHRFVKAKNTAPKEISEQNKNGFGVYICREGDCLNTFLNNKKYKRLLNSIKNLNND